jgi:hypothetical protein
MCLVTGGLAALSAIASTGIGIMQAQAQNDAAQAEYEEKVRFRNEQFVESQKTLNLQVAQQQAALNSETDKAQGEKADVAIEAYQTISRARVSAAESGVVGLSVDNLVSSIKGEAGRFNNRVDYNTKVAGQNADNELKNAKRGAQARLTSIPIPSKPKFNTGLQIGAAVVSGLGQFASAT